ALMVVWRLPCESKSSPAFKSKHPLRISRGGVFYCKKENLKAIYKISIVFSLLQFMIDLNS
ncbi:hypothetical protein, partial [Acinetobacter junii]|uniref:hypothetical protein n=1 Tax=Acinetobacter junii TaxID=40215 RepID=UPI00244A698F